MHAFDVKTVAPLVVLCLLFGAIGGFLAGSFIHIPKTNEQEITDFYVAENAASVSPSDYVSHLKQGREDGLVVDLRTEAEYAAGHLVTAVNVPVGTMSEEQVVAAFRALSKDKPIIMYCYSEYCMLSRKVGLALADNGIYAMHMTAGWYEINRDFADYVVKGSAPGALSANQTYAAPMCTPLGNGKFSC